MLRTKQMAKTLVIGIVLAFILCSVAFAATNSSIYAKISTQSVMESTYERVSLYISCDDGTAIKGYITRCNASGTVLSTYSTKTSETSSGTLSWDISYGNIVSGYRAYGYPYSKISGTWYVGPTVSVAL